MWMNLDQLPAGKSMFTVAVTDDPIDTPEDARTYEEVDVIAPSRSTATQVIEAARDEIERDYESTVRVVGVSNQSDAYVMIEKWEGIER